MTYPDKEHTIALLTDWQAHHAAVEKLMDGMTESPVGLDPNGALFLTVWNLFDAYTSTLAVEVGDFDDWLQWYQSETDMGKRSKAAGFDGKLRKIKTLENLFWLIEESRKRGVVS